MNKKILFAAVFAACALNLSAQSFTETFDSNSLEWTERAFKNDEGTAIIDKGVMTINSYTKVDVALLLAAGQVEKTLTAFETHCYAPLDIKKPFTISSDVTVKKGEQVGLMFNFKDFGNYYAFRMTEDYVQFVRYEKKRCVGSINQGVCCEKKRNKLAQTWLLKSDGITLEFIVNDEPIMKVRHMPLEYTGFGYYTIGQCELIVDQVTFTQGL